MTRILSWEKHYNSTQPKPTRLTYYWYWTVLSYLILFLFLLLLYFKTTRIASLLLSFEISFISRTRKNRLRKNKSSATLELGFEIKNLVLQYFNNKDDKCEKGWICATESLGYNLREHWNIFLYNYSLVRFEIYPKLPLFMGKFYSNKLCGKLCSVPVSCSFIDLKMGQWELDYFYPRLLIISPLHLSPIESPIPPILNQINIRKTENNTVQWPSPITGNPEWGSPKTVGRSQYVLN